MKSPKISVIIPVKNGENTIKDCLTEIFNQTLISETEVIIIDSGSTDKTLEIINKFPVKLFQIKPEEFGHGKTRNYGVSIAKGEFIVMTVQDARPSSDKWLEIMLQHFLDNKVEGVCGQQVVPHEPDKNPLEWFRPINIPSFNIKQFTKNEFEKLSAEEQWQNCRWDDVNAMYRKSVLEKIPFQEVKFGEDMIWAKDAFTAEYKLVYDMRSQVFHYHHYTEIQKLKERIQQTYYFTFKTFNYLRPNPYNFKYFIRTLYLCFKYKVKSKWWIYNFRIFLVSRSVIEKFIKHSKS
jgi:rhamnosyltransferase